MRILEISRAGLLGSVAVLLVVAVCVRLGLWQLDRRDQRGERNAAVAERLSSEPVVLGSLPPDTAGLTYRRVAVSGVADPEGTFVLAGRSHQGMPGVHVFTPVRLGPEALLVNRGWVPAPDAATPEEAPPRLRGEARIEGVLLPFPDSDADLEDRGFRETWYRMDGAAIRAQYEYPVFPLYLQAAVPTTEAGLPVPLDPPAVDPGPHLSYAVQWFSFAGIFLVGWVVLLLRRPRDRAGGWPGG